MLLSERRKKKSEHYYYQQIFLKLGVFYRTSVMLTKPVFGRVGCYFYSAVFSLLFLLEHSEWRNVKECSLSALPRINGRKPVGFYVQLNSFIVLLKFL